MSLLWPKKIFERIIRISDREQTVRNIVQRPAGGFESLRQGVENFRHVVSLREAMIAGRAENAFARANHNISHPGNPRASARKRIRSGNTPEKKSE